MSLDVVGVKVKWDGYMGATGYELWVDGKKKATYKAATRVSGNIPVDDATTIEIVALPARVGQTVKLTQTDGTL